MDIVKRSIVLNEAIEKKFKPLNWIDTTVWTDEKFGSITFTDNGEPSAEFFSKMEKIKNFIIDSGFAAELVMFPADKECPYDEATIKIKFGGINMKELVEDAIAFYKMIGGANQLAEKGFDTGETMPLDYCNKIVELCKKYEIPCDDSMPYGILNAEDLLYEFFEKTLKEATKGGI